MSERQWGSIKFWNSHSGYGFISRDGMSDIFAHQSAVEDGIELKQGQLVEFEEGAGLNGQIQALKVIKMEKEEDSWETNEE